MFISLGLTITALETNVQSTPHSPHEPWSLQRSLVYATMCSFLFSYSQSPMSIYLSTGFLMSAYLSSGTLLCVRLSPGLLMFVCLIPSPICLSAFWPLLCLFLAPIKPVCLSLSPLMSLCVQASSCLFMSPVCLYVSTLAPV